MGAWCVSALLCPSSKSSLHFSNIIKGFPSLSAAPSGWGPQHATTVPRVLVCSVALFQGSWMQKRGWVLWGNHAWHVEPAQNTLEGILPFVPSLNTTEPLLGDITRNKTSRKWKIVQQQLQTAWNFTFSLAMSPVVNYYYKKEVERFFFFF